MGTFAGILALHILWASLFFYNIENNSDANNNTTTIHNK